MKVLTKITTFYFDCYTSYILRNSHVVRRIQKILFSEQNVKGEFSLFGTAMPGRVEAR